MRAFCTTSILIALSLATVCAQDPRGGVLGRVVDESDAVVTGVHVRATNTETGVAAVATTNETGRFQVPFLPPGTYRLDAELAGFKKFTRDGIEVRVGESVELTVRMEVGTLTESVKVTAQTPLLETANPSLGQVIDQRRLLELPQRGGNPMELALLTPGVINGTNLRLRILTAVSAISQIATDGAGAFNNEFQIDGVSNTAADLGQGYSRAAYSPPSSAIREVKVETNPYDASVGHTPGSTISVATTSGSNRLHGSLYYWSRNSAFDAPDFFNNKAGTQPNVYQGHRYGYSAGGPVHLPHLYRGKNRTFWFYSAEGNRWGVPLKFTNTVPTAEMREGNFSAFLQIAGGNRYQIYDPSSTQAAPGGRFQRSPFPSNIIPKARLDPVGVKLIGLYPLPNQAGTVDGRNNHYNGSTHGQGSYDTQLVRFDHAFSENHRVFLRVHHLFNEMNAYDRFANGVNGYTTNQIKRGAAFDDVYVLNPRLVLNVRFGVTNAEWLERRNSRGFDLSSLGFAPDLVRLIDGTLATIPRVRPEGYSPISEWGDGDGGNTSLTYNLVTCFTHLVGRHNLKYGADVRVYRSFGNRHPFDVAPDLVFSSTYVRGPLDNSSAAPIGQGLASLLLGVPGGSMERAASYAMQDKFLGLYLQDDFKLTRTMTLNLGLRYELESPITERFNRLVAGFAGDASSPIEAQARANYTSSPMPGLAPADFRVRGGLTWVNQAGLGRSPFAGEKNNVMPRVGLAWQIAPKTILRTGYGLFYDSIGVNKTVAIQTGFSRSTPIQASLDNGLTYVATTANPLPRGLLAPLGAAGGLTTNLGLALNSYNRDRKHAYAQRWSFGFQRLLPAQVLADVSYVGNRGTRLGVVREANPLPARYLSTKLVRDQQNVEYLTALFPSPFRGIDPVFGNNMSREALLRPYPQFGDIGVEDPVGYSWYHSLHLRVERRFRQGMTFQLGYAFSKAMEAVEFKNDTDPMPYESIGALDRPHRLSMSGLWEIPVGRGRRFGAALPSALNGVIGGWQLGGVVVRQAGPALGFGNAIFTGRIQDIPLPKSERDVDRWFNVDAGFSRKVSEELAAGRYYFPLRFACVRGDGQASWDFSLLKNFPIREKLAFQFRAEVYNAWNHPSFSPPVTSPTSTTFGRITTTTADGRNWQFVGKVTF